MKEEYEQLIKKHKMKDKERQRLLKTRLRLDKREQPDTPVEELTRKINEEIDFLEKSYALVELMNTNCEDDKIRDFCKEANIEDQTNSAILVKRRWFAPYYLERIDQKIESLCQQQESTTVKCPNCGHTFIPQ